MAAGPPPMLRPSRIIAIVLALLAVAGLAYLRYGGTQAPDGDPPAAQVVVLENRQEPAAQLIAAVTQFDRWQDTRASDLFQTVVTAVVEAVAR